MAVLTDAQKVKANKALEKVFGPEIPFNKNQIFATWQKLEDLVESGSFQDAVSNAIDTGMSPLSLNAAQKTAIAKIYFGLKATI